MPTFLFFLFFLLRAVGFVFLGLNDLDTGRFGNEVSDAEILRASPCINFLRLEAPSVSLY